MPGSRQPRPRLVAALSQRPIHPPRKTLPPGPPPLPPAACEPFERLGARPWAHRARNELRATGQTKPRVDPYTRVPLTPQEGEIASLAAAGLTNKQIAERLFLSPRTVGSHLHRIFPKLGIATRAALRDALAAAPQAPPGGTDEHP